MPNDTLTNRRNARWAYNKETAFHRAISTLAGCMEKGLTIWG